MKALITNMNFGSTRKNKKAIITKLFETIMANVTTLFFFSNFKR